MTPVPTPQDVRLHWPDGDATYGRPPGFTIPVELVHAGVDDKGCHVWKAVALVRFDEPPRIWIGRLPADAAVVIEFDNEPT